jgi:hypothetical protein
MASKTVETMKMRQTVIWSVQLILLSAMMASASHGTKYAIGTQTAVTAQMRPYATRMNQNVKQVPVKRTASLCPIQPLSVAVELVLWRQKMVVTMSTNVTSATLAPRFA